MNIKVMKTNTLSNIDKKRVKELYNLMPYLSAYSIAKDLHLKWCDVLAYLKTIGYTNESHLKSLKVIPPVEARPVKKAEPKPTPKAQEPSVNTFLYKTTSRKQAPETIDNIKQKGLNIRAMKLLQEATRAGEEGRIDDYLRLRKEYELADRQAKAFRMRGRMDDTDKEIFRRENPYSIIE